MYFSLKVASETTSKACPFEPNLATGLAESKSVLFAQERRAFRVNKAEKWQTLYNKEQTENLHSAPALKEKTIQEI